MSCDDYEVGTPVRAISDFSIAETLAAAVGARHHDIRSGDAGEVTKKRIAGNFHWLIIRRDHLSNRTLNLEPAQFEFVRPIPEEHHE